MLQVYDFLGGGREGWFSAPLSFVPLENPDFPNARKKGRRARATGLQGGGEEKIDPSLSLSGVQMRWLIATGNLCLSSLSVSANSKLDRELAKVLK